jgi:histidinol-phosphate aminotransferase
MFLQLSTINEIRPCPSAANFILFRTEQNKATPIFDALKEQGIYQFLLDPLPL